MKNHCLFITLIIISKIHCYSQLSTLSSPASPAANLIGISNDQIPVYSNLTKIAGNLFQSTKDLTIIPQNFSFDFAPFINRDTVYKISSTDNLANQTKTNFRNTLFSIAYAAEKEVDLTKELPNKPKLALGFNLPLKFWKAKALTQKSKKRVLGNSINVLNDKHKNALIKDIISEDQNFMNLFTLLNNGDVTQIDKKIEFNNNLKKLIYSEGFTINFSGGHALDYIENDDNGNKNNLRGSKTAFWITTGYSFGISKENRKENNLTILGIIRKNYNTYSGITNVNNINSFDYGFKFNFMGLDETKLNFGVEFVKKELTKGNDLKLFSKHQTWYNLYANYTIGLNTKLSMAIIKDFENKYTKTGNLFALVNLTSALGRTH